MPDYKAWASKWHDDQDNHYGSLVDSIELLRAAHRAGRVEMREEAIVRAESFAQGCRDGADDNPSPESAVIVCVANTLADLIRALPDSKEGE